MLSMRISLLAFITVLCCSFTAKQDSVLKGTRDTSSGLVADSAAVKPIPDTISAYIRMPDSARHDQFVDTLLKKYAFNPYQFYDPLAKKKQLRTGNERPQRNQWIIAVILVLLIYAGIINRLMSKDIYNVIKAFYLKATLAKISREDSILTSWAFIFLFALFGFTVGLYLYQLSLYYNISYDLTGFQLYIACSVLVIVLALLKIMVLRVLGFVFKISPLIREYVSILYLTYFNIAFIFLPVVICFSLFSPALMPSLLIISEIFVVIIVVVQYARSIFNIISNFTFHKIYLFIYLCALEICPVLILIKALNL